MTPAAFALLVSTTAASLGVPVEATVQAPAGASYSLDLERSTTDTFSITKAEPPKVTILPLAVGKLPVTLYWKVQGQNEPVAGPPLVLDVAEPPVESPTIADIKPPISARPLIWPWLLGLLAAGAAAYWWSRRRRAELAQAAEEAARRPAHELALEAFGALEALWSEGRRREFYFALTDELKLYFERRFGFPATRETTAELLRALTASGLERPFVARVRALFERADLVKFADVKPEPGWGPSDLASARLLVEETAPKPEPEPRPQAQEAKA